MGLRGFLCFILLGLALTACSSSGGGDDNSGGGVSLVPEVEYCTTVASVSDPATITSKAEFYAYKVTSLGLISPTGLQNVRRAEVQVLNSAGTTIQCGETDASGNISLQIPKTAGSYTLKVNSRADNSYLKTSVLSDPNANTLYSISTVFSLDGSETSKSVTLTAAPASTTGGAFNILDQVYRANEFLRDQYTQCQTDWAANQATVCTTFTVAPMVKIFWSKGLNPGQYIGYPDDVVSFYTGSGTAGIYVLGGKYGEGSCQDTDHFDNSVILHEYGHFLENTLGKTDSQGGAHDGDSVIDPRLAWSEGWGDYFQGAVLNHTASAQTHGSSYVGLYRDTIGTPECSSGTHVAITLDLEDPNRDILNAGHTGEGVFREVSVARTLWDIQTAVGSNGGAADGYSTDIGFGPIWTVFRGFASSSLHFRNMGLFNKNLQPLIDLIGKTAAFGTDTTTLLGNEMQRADENEYGLNLTAQNGATCTFGAATLDTVANDVNLYGAFVASTHVHYGRSIHKSDDFFEFYYDGTAANSTLKLYYSGGGTPNDLDLYLYTETYVYEDTTTILKSSVTAYPEGAGYESISLSGLSAGTYLINVRAKTTGIGGKTDPTYYIENSIGDRLCP